MKYKARVGRAVAYALGDPDAVPAELGGVTFCLRPAGRTTGGAFWTGAYEDSVVRLLVALLEPGAVVADVGANVGLVGLRLAAHLRADAGPGQPSGHVLLFEPVPANLAALDAAVAWSDLSSHTTVLRYGLLDRRTSLPINVEGRNGNKTGNAVVGGSVRRAHTAVVVEFAPLDELLAASDLPTPTLVKIDAEGSEFEVLHGARAAIAATEPLIFGEFHSQFMADLHAKTFLDVAELLSPWGYRAFSLASDTTLVEATPRPGLGDVLLVPERRLKSTISRLGAAGVRLLSPTR